MSAEDIALKLFDGDEGKAYLLLQLLHNFCLGDVKIPEFSKLKMNLKMDDCRWCRENGECWFRAPDSLFLCEGQCNDYEPIVKEPQNKND